MKGEHPHKLVFFVGTDAELIKLFPILLKITDLGLDYKLVCSGQNDLNHSYILNQIVKKPIDLELSSEDSIVKSARGLLTWFIKTNRITATAIRNSIAYSKSTVFIVHGDTVSTVMGAIAAKKLGLRLAHVEAGLRSFNWLNPFPEEIDRSIVSKRANIHFAPGDAAMENLKRAGVKGQIINTHNNTLIDSLAIAQTIPCKNAALEPLIAQPHSVMVVHRQENLNNLKLVREMVDIACQPSDSACAFIMHEPTRVTLQAMGLLDKLEACPTVTLLPRVEYCDFMKLLGSSDYVLTDGGSNQEELSYMGIPALILRTHTERQEGLGKNATLYDGSVDSIKHFLSTYQSMRRNPVSPEQSPSSIIADSLSKLVEE